MACLEGPPTQRKIFGLRIQVLGLYPSSVTSLLWGLEKLSNFLDLGC